MKQAQLSFAGVSGVIGYTRTRLLLLILRHYAERGFGPSIDEMGRATGKTKNGVKGHLNALRREGLVTWEPGKARTVRPTCRFVSL